MKKLIDLFRDSAATLKSIRTLSVTGLLIAIYAALEFVTVQPSETLKINFGFLAIAAIGMLFGPVVGFFGAGLCDVVGFLVKPSGAFVPVFTLIAMVQGLIYGLVAYRGRQFFFRKAGDRAPEGKKQGWDRSADMAVRLVIARVLDVAIVNLLLNTAAISLLYSKAFNILFSSRLAKNLIELPIDIFLIALILPAVLRAYESVFGRSKATD